MRARRAIWLMVPLLLLGAFLRFHQLGQAPPGLYQDEAWNGLDALGLLSGAAAPRVYFEANNGREPVFIYMVTASVAAFGRTAFALRLPSAFIGLLTVAATFALGRALFDRRVGLLAAAVASAAFWPLALSRIGLRAGLLPLVTALSLACAAHGWRLSHSHPGRSLRWLALGGALYGLTFYTYLAARFTPAALFAFLIFWYIARRLAFPSPRQLAAFALPAALVALPLALVAVHQPEIVFGRAGQVSILNPDISGGSLWAALFNNLFKAVGMFMLRGDDIARHNLPGRPVFDPLLGLAWLAGVGLAVWRAWARRGLAEALLLICTGALLLPTVLAEDTPHFLRAAGVLPWVFVFPALAFEAGLRAAGAGRARPGAKAGLAVAPAAASMAVALILLAGLGLTVRDYFGRYVTAPDTGYMFQAAPAGLARESLAWLAGGEQRQLYLDGRYWRDFASLRFLLPARTAGLQLIEEGDSPSAWPGEVRVVAWPYTNPRPALSALPEGHWVQVQHGPLYRGDLETRLYPLYGSWTAWRDCVPGHCGQAPLAEFEGGLRLASYAAGPLAGGLRLELGWQASHAPGSDVQVFAVAFDGPPAQGALAQADGPLGSELYPASWWRADELVVEERFFDWPDGAAPAGVEIHIGLYDLATGARRQRTDAPGDSVVIDLERVAP
jgi:4-amino-4-deoxy-L-arabinose transferase-like glycosyltransferase